MSLLWSLSLSLTSTGVLAFTEDLSIVLVVAIRGRGDSGGDMAHTKAKGSWKPHNRAEVLGDVDPRQLHDLQASADAIPQVMSGLEKNAFDLRVAVAESRVNEVKRLSSLISEGVALLRKLIYG